MHISSDLFLVLAILAVGVTAALAEDTYMVNAGQPRHVIVLPNDAAPTEKYAARELQEHLEQISGARLLAVPERLYTNGPFVSIGRTEASRKYVTDEELGALGDDGYRVFNRDGNAFFIGGRRRGAMYAVYEYLESLGVRWYSPEYTVIPKLADVKMPAKPFEFKPAFWSRNQYWNNGTVKPGSSNTLRQNMVEKDRWLTRMRINGSCGSDHMLSDEMGGSIINVHGCHSYHILVPPDQYLDKHPEWYALKEDGKRNGWELCLTNPELREFVTQRVLTDLRAMSGKADWYWVSQNDGGSSACFCEKCTAERVAHGGKDRWSANTISFVNAVADKVTKEFPKVKIKTLAYNYTKEAPENLKASDGVLVEICGNFEAGDDPHARTVKSWSRVAENISVYTYGGSNYGYWWPCPNVYEDGMLCKRALAAGVKAFYVQGTALGKGSGLVDAKAYITARLAWDPSRDVNAEIKDFCEGFYGPGGKYVLEYLEWYPRYIREHDLVMDAPKVWGDSEAWRKWVTKESMDYCDGLFRKAIAATRDNPVYLKHVRQAYLEVLWGTISVNLQPGSDLMDKELKLIPGADEADVRARARLFGEIMRENGYNKWREDLAYSPAEYRH